MSSSDGGGEWGRERPVLVAVGGSFLAVAVVFVLLGGGLPSGDPLADAGTPRLVDVNGTGHHGSATVELWPYVATGESFETRASSVNFVIRGDPERVRALLARSGQWNESDQRGTTQSLDPNLTGWAEGTGTPRHLYVAGAGDAGGRWVEPTYHLYRGEYLGAQEHVRAFVVGDSLTVMQVHREHFDWFVLTHAVDGLSEARADLEASFMGAAGVDDVRRVHYANGDTFDADGWATLVVMGGAGTAASAWLLVVLAGVPVSGLRRLLEAETADGIRAVGLAAALAGLVVGVRVVGIALSESLGTPPSSVDVPLFAVFVLAVPVVAALGGRGLPRTRAGVAAAGGFAAGVVADYALLGVAVVPIELAVHRAFLCVAVAGIASGTAATGGGPRARDSLRSLPRVPAGAAGLVLWAGLVVVPHLV